MTAQAQVRIDGAALRNNLDRVRALAPRSRVMAVVKANAYGHGIAQVTRALDGADAFAVARMGEALAVRQAGSRAPVLLLEGIMHAHELDLAAREHIELTVHRHDQIAMLKAYRGQGRFRIWLKIDTGMCRLGFSATEAAEAYRALTAIDCVESPLTLMTHLACADEPDGAPTRRQLGTFADVTAGWPGARSVANSAGVLGWPDCHGDWVRPGLMLYGVSPMVDNDGGAHDLAPAMTLWSRLISIKRIEAGDRVGYGGTWVADRATHVGIVAAGYGDGYPWRLPSGTPVLVGERTVPTVGRVSMDMLAVDLGPTPVEAVGDEAVLWGAGLGVETLARRLGTIPYELLCGISQRVRIDITHPVASPSS